MTVEIGERSFKASRVFETRIDIVWKAWTTPEYIARWWGPNGFTNTIHRRSQNQWQMGIYHAWSGWDGLTK